MPYFDDRTYAVMQFVRDGKTVRRFAEEFYENCRFSGRYPRPILKAMANALARNNVCEILIMADATTKFAQNMADAFDDEVSRAVTRESRFELICVAMAALFVYRFGDVRYGNRLYQRAFEEKERYDADYGPTDFAFLAPFVEERKASIHAEAIRDAEQLRISIQEAEEQQRKEHLEIERQRELRKQAKAEEARKKHEERLARHKERNAAREAEIVQFRQKSAAEQLQTIVSGRKVPAAYGIDCAAISDADLRKVPRSILLQVVTSFGNVKDAGWKDLQKRAAAVLSK